MGLEQQGAKPSGWVGTFIGKMMNKFHTRLYREYLADKLPEPGSSILDIGCGGGEFIHYLSQLGKEYFLHGIDHSPEMVTLARKVNTEMMAWGNVAIQEGSVASLPFSENSVDFITAFETIQFWPEIDESLGQVFRVLKENGKLLIFNNYPPQGSKWWKLATLKSKEDYISHLTRAGFKVEYLNQQYKKRWIVVEAVKSKTS